jgi:hypothetical protein
MTNTDWNEWRLIDSDLETVLGILPASESHLYLALNEPGSGELKIPMESDLADSVGSGQFAECSYRGAVRGGFFVENISKGQADASEGAGQWVSISGRGALSLLEDAMVWDDGTTATTRDFTDKTKAEILITLIDEAQARGGLGVLSYDFTAALDSIGETWSDSETYKLTVGSSLLDVVRQFARTGIDFDILPSAGAFVLSAYKLGKGTDKSETVYLRTGVNCEEITSDERGDKIKNALRVAYKEGYISVSDAVSIAARRRREKLLDMKMAQTSSSATTIGAAEVELTKDPKKGISVKVYDGAGARAFVDYDLGDYIMLDVRGSETRYRIYGIQPDWAADRYSQVIVELNSILYENDIQMAQDIEWLKDQWVTANDANLLEVSYWAALGGTESLITTINDIGVVGNKVYITGAFTKVGGMFVEGLTVYDIDTGLFSNTQAFGSYQTIGYKVFVDGTDVYIGGSFDQINGVTAWGLAKYDGAVWTEVGGGVAYDYGGGNWQGGIVQSIEKIGDWLYISGAIDEVGHNTTPTALYTKTARYNLVTDTWEDMGDPGVMAVGYVVLLALAGDIYVGGYTTPYIKKWVSGTTWSTVGSLDGAVKSLAVYGTNILAGGSFTGGIAEWDGAAWNVFNGGCVGDVLDIAIYLTDVYVVGSFTNIGNRVSKCSGGAWSQLTTGLDNTTNAIALHESDVYVGGIFTQAGDKAAVKLAIYFTNFEALIDFANTSSNSFDMGAAIHAAQASSISDADEVPFWEDVSNALRKITWANIKAALDLLFVHLTGNETIAGTKTFTNTINVGVAPPSAGGNGSVNQTAEGLSAGNIAWTFGSTFASFVTGVFSRGTKAAPTAAQSGDVMLKVRGRAYDGAAYGNTSAEIRHVTSEAHAAGAHGTQIELWTTPNTTATMAKVLTVQNDGNINIEAGKTYNVNGVPVGGGGIADAPNDGMFYGRSNAAWNMPMLENVLGLDPNMITNGSFVTDSDWTKGTGWTIDTGIEAAVATNVTTGILEATVPPLVAGIKYLIQYTIIVTSGDIAIGDSDATGFARTASGTYYEEWTSYDGTFWFLSPSSDFTGEITIVSARQMTYWTTAQVKALTDGGATNLHTHSGVVESVSGDGVDNTDPANPVLTYPTPADISAVPMTVLTDTQEPTGWLDPDAVAAAMTYDSTTQKISISGTHSYYWRGIKTSVTNFVSSAHDNTVGHQYYLSSGDGSTFTWATDTVWTFDVIMVAFVNYQTAVKFALAESHGLMQWQVHETLHQTIGTYKESGGTLDPATYTLLSTTAANRRPNVIAAHLHDEDVDSVLAALTSKTYNKFYLSSTATNNFTGETADIVPLLANNPYYNLFSTPNWTQVLMANNSYMCVWLAAMPVTQDAASQAYRYIWIQGQANGNLASQEALQPASLNLGTLSTESSEIVFLVKIIIRYTGGNWDLYSITNLTGSKFSQVGASAGNYLSAVTTNGSLTGDGTTGNPLSASSGATTATAVGTTTLTVSSATIQEFTGATTQTVVLPVVTTLRLGHQFRFINNSSGLVTVNSSGGNLVTTVAAGATVFVSCILITGTTAASWSVFNAAATYSTLASMSAANAALLVGTTALTTLHTHQPLLDGWNADANTWTYFNRTQAFTNDPAAGVAITLNMVDTTNFVVGSDVTVSSSAGSENTYVTAVVANTSITVNQCVLNHTTTSRLVTLLNVFTISGDVSATIQKGALLKWAQTTVKYGVVFSSTYSAPNTYIVIMLSTDYPLTNAAISLNYFSYLTAPAGWPTWFNFDAAPLGFSALPAAVTKYSVVGKTIMMNIILSTGTSNATTFTSSTPCKVALAAATVNTLTHDNSANLTTPARTTVATNTRTTSHWSNLATGAWTNSGTKGVTLMLSYEW